MGLLSTRHFHDNRVSVNFPDTIKVHEHKAPTDESVSLLNEFQDKARKNIIATIKIEENYLKAVIIYFQDDIITNRIVFHIRFELNGKEYRIEDHIDKFEWGKETEGAWREYGSEIVYRALHKRFSEALAFELLKQSPGLISGIIKQ